MIIVMTRLRGCMRMSTDGESDGRLIQYTRPADRGATEQRRARAGL